VHERQQPDVAEAAPHRADHAAPVGRRIGDARRFEQSECRSFGDVPLRTEGSPGEITEEPARFEALGPCVGLDRRCRQRADRIGRAGLAVLETDP